MSSLRERGGQVGNVEEDSMALMTEHARSYQIELFEFAKKNNTIVCLGTGTGKTFISVLLIKHFEHEVSGPWLDENGKIVGKRTVFLAPTVPLVEQQSTVLEQHLSVKTAYFVGSPDLDRWTKERWDSELQEPGVLVMTPEVCRMAVYHDFLPMRNINLLVLDECHRASGAGHPYAQVMEYYASVELRDRPRVLGLTASVVNAQVEGEKVPKKIRELERCLFSVAKTASLNVHQFGTKPTEIIVAYASPDNMREPPVDPNKMSLLSDSPDASEFRRMVEALKKTYRSCGAFCTKKLLEFRERELQKALGQPTCAERFKELAPVKQELYNEIEEFLGENPSIYEVSPKLTKLLEVIKQFENTNLSAVVFVDERLVAYVLYIWMDALSKQANSEFAFVNCSFIVGQSQGGYNREEDLRSLKMNSKDQHKVMRDFRNGDYNLMFATSVIEEGMDVPACNLIVRFDPPRDVRAYTQSKGRARAKPSLYVVLGPENKLAELESSIYSHQQTEQLVMHYCGTERSAPAARHSVDFLREDPDLPPFDNGRARITAASAVSLIYGYCQRFMRLKYPNVFPFFDVESTPDGFVCTLTMPIVCPVREKISNAANPLPSKDKARAFVALEMCKRLHRCGELADNLLPRRMLLNLYKLPLKSEDRQPQEDLKKGMIVTRTRNGEKKRYILPRKQANILKTREENVDCDQRETFYLYVIKTEVIAWAPEEQNWRGDALFDPSKYPTWIGIIMRSKSPKMGRVPKFPIFTRSGEERVSFVYAGSLSLDEREKQLCGRFNRYVFSVVLLITDNMMSPTDNFSTPCLVPVDECGNSGNFELNHKILNAIGRPRLPDFNNFVFREEEYEDAVVELLYHLTENHEKISKEVHDKTPQDFYPRFYVTKAVTCDENGKPLTPNTTGYYPFEESLSFADYALQRDRWIGPQDLLQAYQPILTVEHSHKRLHMLKPRFASQQERRQKFTIDAGTKYVIPQFAAVHAIKASLWRKITSIPSIVHRLNRLLIAEDIRLEISTACRLRQIDFSHEQWPPMDFTHSRKEEVQEMPAREFDALCRNGDRSFDRSKLRFPFVAQPDLKHCLGPSPCDIMKALTTKGCDEVFDLERLELLGDSFLQIVATFSVVDRDPKSDIGELNVLRQYEVNNNHLLYRAHDKQLTQALEVQQFRPCYNFLPFGYRACPLEGELLRREYLCVLVQMCEFGRDSKPLLKDLRQCKNIQECLESFSAYPPGDILECLSVPLLTSEDLPNRHELPVRMVHDFKAKVGGDIVEALVGVYLEKCGPIGALRFFKWIGKDFGDVDTDNFLDAFKLDFSAAQAVPVEEMKQFKHLIDKVERQIGYTFNSKGLVLQAITHHSCREHLLTDDNNKLAFIGEAVVDYLITLYIYGLSSSLNPGQLTDLRIALINKQVTAHAVVRAELHTVLLYTNNNLFTAIKKYLSNVNEIGLRLNTVFDDSETDDAEEAEIPSPIARILQSVLGAVFIDSNKNLETVWDILVNIMGYEISLFTTHVPMSPIKELCNMFPGTTFSKAELIKEGEDEGRFGVKMHLIRDGETETYVQISDTKKIAKITLAKRYLKKLETEKRAKETQERKRAHVTDASVSNLCDYLLESEVQKSKFYRTH